jgi:hypothetical protein
VTKTQHKKYLARLFNLRRDEKLAYEMDGKRFPKATHHRRMNQQSDKISKNVLLMALALSAGIGESR